MEEKRHSDKPATVQLERWRRVNHPNRIRLVTDESMRLWMWFDSRETYPLHMRRKKSCPMGNKEKTKMKIEVCVRSSRRAGHEIRTIDNGTIETPDEKRRTLYTVTCHSHGKETSHGRRGRATYRTVHVRPLGRKGKKTKLYGLEFRPTPVRFLRSITPIEMR